MLLLSPKLVVREYLESLLRGGVNWFLFILLFHVIVGVGLPVAVQVKVALFGAVTVRSTGGSVMLGPTVHKNEDMAMK